MKVFKKRGGIAILGTKNECPICSKTFCDQSTALRHLKHVHAPPYSCDFCAKFIKIGGRPDVLRNHLVRCPYFVNRYQDDSFDQARVQARLIYGKVKASRSKAFQLPFEMYTDSTYMDLPNQLSMLSSHFLQSRLEFEPCSPESNYLPQIFPPGLEKNP